MEAHREDTVQGKSSESIQPVVPCKCDTFVNIGLDSYPTKLWNDECDIHGVGTEYFKSMKIKPFGYAGEKNTTRESWLQYKRRTEKKHERTGTMAVKPVVLDLNKDKAI
jgi:hypothetical protein